MSDYFTRLAERTLGATPLPRPVIPSRFERPSATGLDEVDVEAVGATASGPRAAETRPSPVALAETNAAPQSSDSPVARRTSPASPDTIEHSVEPEPVSAPGEPVVADLASSERVITPDHERVIVERETVLVPPAATLEAQPTNVVAPPPRIETSAITPQPGLQPVVQRDIDRTTVEPAVIHVTIGRIDVRAVTSPPPSRERQHPRRPARPSLEEYLRRGGGPP